MYVIYTMNCMCTCENICVLFIYKLTLLCVYICVQMRNSSATQGMALKLIVYSHRYTYLLSLKYHQNKPKITLN